LYGPAGTGKELLAIKIGEMFNARPPKLVDLPGILGPYVGQSSEREYGILYAAEEEYRDKGEESELYITIFDELDAIFTQRGSRSTSIYNELLAKMDGVERINNILVIGITNRKDLIDEALLRRFEVQMEIGFLDETGRVPILAMYRGKKSLLTFAETARLQGEGGT